CKSRFYSQHSPRVMMGGKSLLPEASMSSTLSPPYQEIQAHYDLSNDFYRLFLGPTMVYSCAYLERDEMTLDEAQEAKTRRSLGKCERKPGQRLLDIGCGWGSTILRA